MAPSGTVEDFIVYIWPTTLKPSTNTRVAVHAFVCAYVRMYVACSTMTTGYIPIHITTWSHWMLESSMILLPCSTMAWWC